MLTVMGIFIKRLASIILVAGGWLLAGVRLALDLIGWSTAPDDVDDAMSRLDQLFVWVLSLPWAAVFGFALASTMWLMWVSWPRQNPVLAMSPSSTEAPALELTKLDGALERPSAFEIVSLRNEISEYYCGLLHEIQTATKLRRDGLLTAQEFDTRITGFSARKSSFSARLREHDVLTQAATLVGDGARRRELPLTTARMGNYSADGPYLSTAHANLVATVEHQRSELTHLLADALGVVDPTETVSIAWEPPSLGFNFRLHYPQDQPGQFIQLVVTPKTGATGVVAVGSFAIVLHTIAGAEWRWSKPTRLQEHDSLLPIETMTLPFVERGLLKDNPSDVIRVAGQELQIRGDDIAQGDLILVKVVISSDVSVSEFKQLYNFRRAESRQFIDALDFEAHKLIEDRGALA